MVADAQIELEIGAGPRPGEYSVQVLRATSGGEPQSTMILDVDALLERSRQVEPTVLASAARMRGAVMPEIERPLREIGTQLFAALFSGPIGSTYRASLAVARDRGQGLRVVLRLTASELAVMPWEALYDTELESYVCRTEPLVRHIDAPYTPEPPLQVSPPLRILGVAASPRNLPGLDVEAEKQRLEEALAEPMAAGRVVVEWLNPAAWSSLHAQLLRGHWHVLHFIGHGDFNPQTNEGRLALAREDGSADWVEATDLADLLSVAEPTPRLVVLNSCQSGQAGRDDLFSGTAATLVRRGISAVAAMQFSISDTAAVAFPRGFYTALASGRCIDEAVRSGRIEILGTNRGSLEWVTPVLYLRGEPAELFQVTEEPPSKPARRPVFATTRIGSFLRHPFAIVALSGGVVGLVIISAIVGIVVMTSRKGTAPSQDNAQLAIKDCMVNHGLQRDHEKNEGGTAGTILFRQCSWPAPHGAGGDGYAEVQVTSYDGPGKSEAEGLTVADYVKSACRDTELVYLFNNQGTYVQEQPVTLSKGEIRRVEGGSLWFPANQSEASRFKPGRDESIVMSNRRYKLNSARCI